MSGSGVATDAYQPRGDNLDAMKKAKENSYLYVDSTRRQESTVAPIAASRWPDSVMVQSSIARKKFHCPRCNSGYTRLSDMKTHCQFQCGKEPRYQCPYCTKKAKFSSNMYVHVRRMHKDKKLQIIDLYKQLSRVRYWKCGSIMEKQRGRRDNSSRKFYSKKLLFIIYDWNTNKTSSFQEDIIARW